MLFLLEYRLGDASVLVNVLRLPIDSGTKVDEPVKIPLKGTINLVSLIIQIDHYMTG